MMLGDQIKNFLFKNSEKIKSIFSNNLKIFENYFFMTLLQVVSPLIGFITYPYLIRTLGKESYGLYVFALSVVSFFIVFISFGFDVPAMKKIVENKNDIIVKGHILSSVFMAKLSLSIISTIIFIFLSIFVPVISSHQILFAICFCQTIPELLFPRFYFQAIQKMKIVTYINLFFRLLTIPFIFLFIKKPEDNYIYAIIVSSSMIMGSFTATYMILKDGIKFKMVSIPSIKDYFKDSLPFFWSMSAGRIKEESLTLIIGSFFGMGDVALYDLANKIIIIPRTLTTSINNALFPKMLENSNNETIKKVIKYELFIGLAIILGVILFGYWIVLFFGGKNMLSSYPLTIILSTSILTWLIVGCYINFIFVPSAHFYFVTRNQLVALLSTTIFCSIGLLIYQNIITIALALALSGFCEMLYCRYLTKKYHLL